MIEKLFSELPGSAGMLVFLGLFGTLRRAQRRLQRLAQKKRLKCLGHYDLAGRGAEKVYCKRNVNTPQHDAELLWLLLHVEADQQVKARDTAYNCDAEITVNGSVFFYEHDRDTENVHELKRLMDKYAGVQRPVLWTAPDETRLKEMMRIGQNPMFLFTVHQDAVRPHELVWRNREGKVSALPRSRSPGR